MAATVEGPLPAKASRAHLTPAAEQMLLDFFSLQDQLSREDAAVLAEEVGTIRGVL